MSSKLVLKKGDFNVMVAAAAGGKTFALLIQAAVIASDGTSRVCIVQDELSTLELIDKLRKVAAHVVGPEKADDALSRISVQSGGSRDLNFWTLIISRNDAVLVDNTIEIDDLCKAWLCIQEIRSTRGLRTISVNMQISRPALEKEFNDVEDQGKIQGDDQEVQQEESKPAKTNKKPKKPVYLESVSLLTQRFSNIMDFYKIEPHVIRVSKSQGNDPVISLTSSNEAMSAKISELLQS